MHRNIKILSWFNFFIDFVFYWPVAVLYFAQVTGSYTAGMSIFSVVYISAAIFEVPTGVWSDMIGRKRTVIAGAASSVIAVVLYALGGSYMMLVMGALLEGLSRSLYSGNNDAMLKETLAETGLQREYHRYYGKLNAYNEFGLAIVVVVGSLMASRSYALVYWASLVPRIILLVLAFILIEPTVHFERPTNIYEHMGASLQLFFKNKKLRLLTIIYSFRYALYEGGYQFRTAFVASIWPLWAIGISNMISNVVAAASFYYSGKLLDRFGYKKILLFEVIANRVTNLFALVIPTIASPAIMGTTSFLYGATTTGINAMLQQEFSEKERATMSSLTSLFGSIGFGIAVVALGYFGDHIGPARTLIYMNLCILLLLYLYHRLFTLRRDR